MNNTYFDLIAIFGPDKNSLYKRVGLHHQWTSSVDLSSDKGAQLYLRALIPRLHELFHGNLLGSPEGLQQTHLDARKLMSHIQCLSMSDVR